MSSDSVWYTIIAPILYAMGITGHIANIVTLCANSKFSGHVYTYFKALSLSDLGTIHKQRRRF